MFRVGHGAHSPCQSPVLIQKHCSCFQCVRGGSSGLLLTSDSLICKSLHSWRNYRGLRNHQGISNSDADLLSCILDFLCLSFPERWNWTLVPRASTLSPYLWCPSFLWSALVPVKTLAMVKDYSLFCTVSFLSPSFSKLKGIRLIICLTSNIVGKWGPSI